MTYKIPFDENGNMMTYTDSWCTSHELKDNFEWEDELVYTDYSKGRSAVNFEFTSRKTGKIYNMFLSDFCRNIIFLEDGKLKGKFTFIKRGSNFGIMKVEENT